MPSCLQTLIKEYERIPRRPRLHCDRLVARRDRHVTLSDLLDERPTNATLQRLLVRVEKGTILNGENDQEVTEGYHVSGPSEASLACSTEHLPSACGSGRS